MLVIRQKSRPPVSLFERLQSGHRLRFAARGRHAVDRPVCGGSEENHARLVPRSTRRRSLGRADHLGRSPATGTLLSFPSAKKPSDLPSADQKGDNAPSLDGISRGSSRSSGRTQSVEPVFENPINAIELPSGDTASWPKKSKGA